MGLYHEWGYESSLSVPIVVGGEMVGLIELYDDAERDWGDEVDFLTNVSQHLAGIFANTVLLDEVQRHAAYERELVGLAESLSQSADGARSRARRPPTTLRRVLDAEDCDIWHLDEGRLRCLRQRRPHRRRHFGRGQAARPRPLPDHGEPRSRIARCSVFTDLDDPRLDADGDRGLGRVRLPQRRSASRSSPATTSSA